jgi:hypothetical protein
LNLPYTKILYIYDPAFLHNVHHFSPTTIISFLIYLFPCFTISIFIDGADSKSGANISNMSIEERKSYCKHDAHLVAGLVRVNSGDILKIMQVIANHTGLRLEEVYHKGMTGIWTKILNDAISKKVALVGYENLPITLRKLYSNKH